VSGKRQEENSSNLHNQNSIPFKGNKRIISQSKLTLSWDTTELLLLLTSRSIPKGFKFRRGGAGGALRVEYSEAER